MQILKEGKKVDIRKREVKSANMVETIKGAAEAYGER